MDGMLCCAQQVKFGWFCLQSGCPMSGFDVRCTGPALWYSAHSFMHDVKLWNIFIWLSHSHLQFRTWVRLRKDMISMKIHIFRKLFSDGQVELSCAEGGKWRGCTGMELLTQIAVSICRNPFVTSGPQCWDFFWGWCSSSAFSPHGTVLQSLPLTDS